MKVYFLTLALDAMPWIAQHILPMNLSGLDFHWYIIEGVAEPVKDTSWCKQIEPRLSRDGTHEYLVELARNHPRVTHYYLESWPGKTAMCNHAMPDMKEPGLLWLLDSDELWSHHQMQNVHMMFKANPKKNEAYFRCDYWLGSNIKIVSKGAYGDNHGEWLRVFRYEPYMRWVTHEPPMLNVNHHSNVFTKEQTEKMGLVFQHPAYMLEKTVAFKERFYGYSNAVFEWRQLQNATQFPCRVGDYLSWVKDAAICDKITPV